MYQIKHLRFCFVLCTLRIITLYWGKIFLLDSVNIWNCKCAYFEWIDPMKVHVDVYLRWKTLAVFRRSYKRTLQNWCRMLLKSSPRLEREIAPLQSDPLMCKAFVPKYHKYKQFLSQKALAKLYGYGRIFIRTFSVITPVIFIILE